MTQVERACLQIRNCDQSLNRKFIGIYSIDDHAMAKIKYILRVMTSAIDYACKQCSKGENGNGM